MTLLLSSPASTDKDNQIILADKNDLGWSDQYFSKEEAALVKNLASKDAPYALISNAERFVVVEFFKHKEEQHKNSEAVRRAAAERISIIRHYKADTVTLLNRASANYTAAYAEGLALANYQFLKYFKDKAEKTTSLKNVKIAEGAVTESALAELSVLLEAVTAARDLVNEPLSYLTATKLSEEFGRLGQASGFGVEVLNKAQIQALGMGGLLGVNLGSQQPPTFTVMEWKPANARNAKPVVLVGKGVVYDTGGLSLKPTPNSMDYMKCDMAGAALVGAVMYAVAKSNLPIHVVGLVPATDNRPGEDAYVPGDVLTMMSGSTVEVLNTDAEGRLILADALHYAKRYDPALVLDFATLTGAAAVAIGPQGVVYMGTAEEATKKVFEDSGNTVYERIVEFPLWDEYAELLKSEIADLKNIGGPSAGAITAGKFLEHFTAYPWLHFDIAGPAFLHSQDGYRLKGGTGIGVRLVYDALKKLF